MIAEERRSRSARPPTYLMQSYNEMTAQARKGLRKLGVGILLFCIALPMVAQVTLSVLDRPGLSAVFWLFSGVGMVVGLCLVWPQLGIYAIGALPGAVRKLLPTKLAAGLARPDRRGDEND